MKWNARKAMSVQERKMEMEDKRMEIKLNWDEMEMLIKIAEKNNMKGAEELASKIVSDYLVAYNKKLEKALEKVSELQY